MPGTGASPGSARSCTRRRCSRSSTTAGAATATSTRTRTGYAVSLDLRSFTKVTCAGPALASPYASGSLRYLDAVHLPAEGRLLYYFEMARADGAHELRVDEVRLP